MAKIKLSPFNRGNQHGSASDFAKVKVKVDELNLDSTKVFTVKHPNDRVLVQRHVKALRNAGKLKAQISTREIKTKKGERTNTYRVFSVPN